MKIRTTKYIIKDGIINTYRNKLMSLASIGIVSVSLLTFGLFFIITVNANRVSDDALNMQSEIVLYCDPEWDESQAARIENAIKNNNEIREYRKITKQEALEQAKKELEDNKNMLDSYGNSFLPITFIFKLKDPSKSKEIVSDFEKMEGVDEVRFHEIAVNFFLKLSYWAKVIGLMLLIILLIISAFIISNTIKLTVFARRREIGIMKYIGATDWFIRLPFIVEGILIGLVGALIAVSITFLCYNTFETRFSTGVLALDINLVKISDIGLQVFGITSLIGMIVGGVGSVISIRKYLRV